MDIPPQAAASALIHASTLALAPPTPSSGEHPLAQRLGSLQAALDLIDQGFTLINENLQLVAWNKAFFRLLDFPDSMAYEGAPFENFMRYNAVRGEYGEGDPEAQVRERVDAARTFQPHVLERMRPNGMVLRVQGVPVPGHGFVTLYSDVTQQRRSEQLIREQNSSLETRVIERTAALQRSEAQMRLITDSIPALVAYFDVDLHYRYINRGYQDWFGIDPAHPEHVSAREFLGLDTYRTIKPHIKKALQGEAVTFEYEVATIHPDAPTTTTLPLLRLARTTLIPEANAQGHVIGCFELTFDITEQRRAHEMLVQAQKMEALGQLTSGLSHDFNNILTVILGNLSALSELPEVQRHRAEYITPAMEAARRGSELIRGLLSFSRQQPQQTSRAELGQLIANVDRLVRHTLPDSLQLVFIPHDHDTWCELDPHQFENALLNLILNARDATESRGHITVIKTHHRLTAAQATPLHLKAGAYACITVSDNGCGMDTATRSRVFEPFFTTKLPGRGSGLGLSMVYGFARQSGGTVDIRSEPGIGTDMQVWLPLTYSSDTALTEHNEDETAPLDALPSLLPSPPPELALLVEDDADVRKIIRRQLLELGFVVLEADNGREALSIIEQTPNIQLVLSDFVMPGGVDGQAVTAYARQRHVPQVVLMSGHLPDIKPHADDGTRPAMPVLAKPFTREDLAAVVSAPLPHDSAPFE